jgi:aryl-alcohol dehydrogenase-like predicted oxidoreductase
METRRFGRTGHQSTIAILGGAAFGTADQDASDRAMELAIAKGVNHIDIAPSYGEAELRLGPWIARERSRFFLGCKTQMREREAAWKELHESLRRLRTDRLDLYQCHAVTTMAELDAVTMKGGALDAIVKARGEGLTRYIGITGHGVDAPAIFLEALRRFDFDSVLFPLNFVQMALPGYRRDAEALLAECARRDVGTMVIKTITKGPWGARKPDRTTWYEPFTDPLEIRRAVDFALSWDVTGLCTAGDLGLLPAVLEACEGFTPLDAAAREEMIAGGDAYTPLFPASA